MRCRFLTAMAAVAAAGMLASQPAAAFGLDQPDLRNHEFDADHADALDRYYGYYYDPRGWYPYYNSGEWGPPYVKRFKGSLPPYYGAWGANNRRYYHVDWHRQHYGGHRRGNW